MTRGSQLSGIRTLVLSAVVLAAVCAYAGPKETLAFADSCYKVRAVGAKGDKADRALADKMTSAYVSLIRDKTYGERAAVGAMQSVYFRIRFASQGDKDKFSLIKKAKLLGDTLHSLYPKNYEITGIYAAIYSMWGVNEGALKSVKNGVAARVRDLADSSGNYQVLGRTHQLLPHIPIILSWPDKKLARKYLQLALDQHPEDLYNYFFLAELYTDSKEYDKAESMIAQGLERGVRPDFVLEDNRARWHMKEVQATIDKKRGKKKDKEKS